MKNKLLFIVLSMLIIASASNSYATNLKAQFTFSTFNSPKDGPYIETYLSVQGNSVVYDNNESIYSGVVEITYVFKQNNEIKKFMKYNLSSPSYQDSGAFKIDFIDQQRISLPKGSYDFEITLRDTNSIEKPFYSSQPIVLNYNNSDISISDIELIETLKKTEKKSSFSKSGYDIFPYTSDFYPENFEKIAFYAEIYNANKLLSEGENFLINYSITSAETNKIVGNYKGFIRSKTKSVNIVLQSFSIEKLSSGNYHLSIEARNKLNEIIVSKKVFFQRSNPQVTPILLTDAFQNSFVNNIKKENLEEFIKTLYPISTDVEVSFSENQLKGRDEVLMKQFFYNFWVTRNEDDPEGEWKKYYELIKIVNHEFRTGIKKGYETDRGRVYLRYGKPNSRTVFPLEPLSYPYEIWHYYKAGRFSNIKYVFYSPDEVTNDYPLLHSNLPGELNNPQWKIQLHIRNTPPPINPDAENYKPHYGESVDDYYNNPR